MSVFLSMWHWGHSPERFPREWKLVLVLHSPVQWPHQQCMNGTQQQSVPAFSRCDIMHSVHWHLLLHVVFCISLIFFTRFALVCDLLNIAALWLHSILLTPHTVATFSLTGTFTCSGCNTNSTILKGTYSKVLPLCHIGSVSVTHPMEPRAEY